MPEPADLRSAGFHPVAAYRPPRSGVDPLIRDYIASTLAAGHPRAAVVAELIRTGWGAENAARSVDAMIARSADPGTWNTPTADPARPPAKASPAAPADLTHDRAVARLNKREWLATARRRMMRLDPRNMAVERRPGMPRAEFLREYYAAGRPVVISGMIDHWPALRKWGLDDLAARFGPRTIRADVRRAGLESPIAGTDAPGGEYEIYRHRSAESMTVADFVRQARGVAGPDQPYIVANRTDPNRAALGDLWGEFGPIKEYLTDDPRSGLFWFGGAGTVTPWHHDVMNILVCQVVGRKRFLLSPPWDATIMNNFRHVYSAWNGADTPENPAPADDEPQVWRVDLGPGDCLFLPVGTFHRVESLEESMMVSFINFLWPNGFPECKGIDQDV